MSSTALNPALQAHFTSDAAPRPILTSLNGDNSWLISFPRPAAERARHGNKAYFHVVSDAWLTRDTVLFSPWILNLRNQAEAAIPDGPAVERLIREIETAAGAANLGSGAPAAEPQPSPVDAIFQNFHYSDHLDERTLRTFDPDTPVFATAEATAVIRPWHHFRHLATTRDLDPAKPEWLDLRPEGDAQLPEWLSIFRLVGHHPLNFATAIVYSSDSAAPDASDGNSPPTAHGKTRSMRRCCILRTASAQTSHLSMRLRKNWTHRCACWPSCTRLRIASHLDCGQRLASLVA